MSEGNIKTKLLRLLPLVKSRDIAKNSDGIIGTKVSFFAAFLILFVFRKLFGDPEEPSQVTII
jgi:hypothetical protein